MSSNLEIGYSSTGPDRIILDDLLSREPQIARAYRQSTGCPAKVFAGRVTELEDELLIEIHQVMWNAANESELRTYLAVPDGITITHTPLHDGAGFFTNSYRLPHVANGGFAPHPLTEQLRDNVGSIIAPWPNKGYMSP